MTAKPHPLDATTAKGLPRKREADRGKTKKLGKGKNEMRENLRKSVLQRRGRQIRDGKAVSPVVATLILILVAVAAAAALYLWLVAWQGNVTGGIGSPSAQSTLTIGGSTSVYPFTQVAVQQFQQNNSNIVISNNQGGYEGGGGVANLFNANLTINNSPSNKSVVSSNQASIAGGVLNLFGGTVQVNGAQVVNNTAAEFGGGLINAVNGSMALTGALVKGNTASNGNGGGIVNECNGTLNLTNTMVQSNTAINGVGGGLYFNSTYPATLSGDTFTQNKPDAMNGGSTC